MPVRKFGGKVTGKAITNAGKAMARLVVPLTDLKCRQAKVEPGRKCVKLSDGQGLFLDVLANGKKRWRMRYTRAGKESTITFGEYPGVSLATARMKREEVRAILADGKDPVVERTLANQTLLQSNEETFEAIAIEWLGIKKNSWSEGYHQRISNALKANVYPYIGKVPMRRITGLIVLDVVKKVERRDALDMARRVLGSISQVCRYATGTGRADGDVTQSLGDFLEEPPLTRHHPHVDVCDLPELLRRIDGYSGRPETVYAMKLMLHTFPRTSELRWARWEEFDFNNAIWRIPSERMKGRKRAKESGVPHEIPLSRQIVGLLKELQLITGKYPFLFPGLRNPRTTVISAETINKALKIMGYKGEQTGHGFRGLASTILNESRLFRWKAIDATLAHKNKNQIEASYNHAKYLAERREILQWWSDYLTAQRNALKRAA